MTTSSLPPNSDNLKRCSRCHEYKPRETFSRDKTKRDGLLNQCKACHAACRAANPERVAKRRRAYNAANAERQREYQRAYFQTDAGKAAKRASNHRRRARKAGASGTCTASDLIAIRAAQTDKRGRLMCWICGKPIKGTPHLDHFMPLDKGGPNSAGNLHYTHAKCNLEKSAKLPAELGRLI